MANHRTLLLVSLGLAALANAARAEDPVAVSAETFIRAETDRMFQGLIKRAGGRVNQFFSIREPTPLDAQSVVRMNRDTLYMGAVVDTRGGASISVPQLPADRYVSVAVLDNDHYAAAVFYEPGTHPLPEDTRYVALAVRIELKDAKDPEELRQLRELQDRFRIHASSAEPFTPPHWEQRSLDALRARYEQEFQTYQQYAADWQGARGTVNENTRHLAAAAAWGLLPEKDAIYLNYSGQHPHQTCHSATYQVPENGAFWSITVYDQQGYMASENVLLNAANTQLNADGSFTAHFGSKQVCGDRPNRLDVGPGWNFLMRVYRPGPSVLRRAYRLPAATPLSGPQTGAQQTAG